MQDHKIAQKIMHTKDPRKHKKLGREIENFSDDIWNANCQDVVRIGNKAKVCILFAIAWYTHDSALLCKT